MKLMTRGILLSAFALGFVGLPASDAAVVRQKSSRQMTKPQYREQSKGQAHGKKEPRVVYPKKTDLDFEGVRIEGEFRDPGEFYFQYRPEEKFDSLVKRRKNFHREMLRDVVLSK